MRIVSIYTDLDEFASLGNYAREDQASWVESSICEMEYTQRMK